MKQNGNVKKKENQDNFQKRNSNTGYVFSRKLNTSIMRSIGYLTNILGGIIMDKKLVMQETYDGRVQTLEKFNEAREKLYDLYCAQLRKLRRSQERDIETLLSGEAFWDGLTEDRIAIEQEKYLDIKDTVDKIAKLIDDLCTYVDVMAE